MAKTYKEFTSQNDREILQNLIDDLDLTNEEYEGLLEGKKTNTILRVIAFSLSKRLGTQVKRVKSTNDLSDKIDELAKAIAIAGGIAAIAVAGQDGGKSALSKIVGFTAGSG